jgi:hypothetical protein
VLQEGDMNDRTCMLIPVKEEHIKPEITFEDDDILVGNKDGLGSDEFFNFQNSEYMFEICSCDCSRIR